MTRRRELTLTLLLVGCVGGVAAIYLLVVPRHVAAGNTGRTLAYIAVGWVPYALCFYAAGRLLSAPEELPSMRFADVGLALFLVSLLVSLGLDTLGFGPELVPVGHVLPAIGVYVGLALLGWGLGRRSRAIERFAEGSAG